jgi:predicted permease
MSWRRFLRRANRDAESARDIQFYLDTETEDNLARGMTPEEARAAARRKFGNPTFIREEIYRRNSFGFLETLRQDLSYALRTMRHKPGFTAAVVLTLALGIGANTAVFSIVDAVFLRPLPYKDPSRLVAIWDKNVRDSGISKMFDSFQDFEEIAQHGRAFDRVAAATWAVGGRLLSGHGPTRDVLAMPVSESFFPLLGIAPARGRTFVPEDVKRGCTVVLSDRLWRGPLAGNPEIVGKSITLDGQPCAVLGIMPPGFAFYPDAAQAWILLTPGFTPPPNTIPVGVFARLKPQVSVAQAQAEVSTLHAALHRSDGHERDLVPVVYPLQEEFAFLAEAGLRTTIWVLSGAVGFVLLMTCLNVATLLLGQAFGRERELALRAALGCGRTRLIRQLLTEAMLLASIGGALGIGMAFSAVRYFHAAAPIEMPIGARVEMSVPVLGFTAAISVVTALLFGLVPAWKASRLDIIESLKTAGRGTARGAPQRLAKALIAAEMALSLMLLVGAGLLMQSVLKMDSEPLGFRAEGLAVTSVTLPAEHYPDAPRRLRFYELLASRLGNNAAFATALPPYGLGAAAALHISDKPTPPEAEIHDVGQQTISPGYFQVLGVRLLRGRAFDWRDRSSAEPVAIINETIAREYFSDEDPIGRRISVGDPSEKNPWRTIVGVVSNDKRSTNYHQIGWVERGAVLKPLAQDPPRSVSIAMRGMGADLQRAVTGVDSAVAVGDTETMQARLGRFLAYPKFRAVLLSAFAVFAVLLAAIGLYGLLRQFVAQRTREIGLRMAVGARPADVLWLIALQGGRPALAGLTAGLIGAAALSRYLSSLLYGVRSGDPSTFGVVSAILLCVAALAAFFPARRAARVDPAVALRNE